MPFTRAACLGIPPKALALSCVFLISTVGAQAPAVEVTATAPQVKLQVVVGSSSVSAAAALDDAKSRVAAAIPYGRVLASQDDECDFVDPVAPFGEVKGQGMYIIHTQAEQPPARVLWVAEAPMPRELQTCIKWSAQLPGTQGYALLREDKTAKAVDTAFEIFHGSELLFAQGELAPDQDTGYGLDAKCFILTEGQMVLSSGAFVWEYSARRLRIPVLVIKSQLGSRGTVLRLQDAFPAER